jgi:cyclophilin family peptidyl-prolyl cis-trans isomerase
MSKRARERKAKKLEEQKIVRTEMRERYKAQNAKLRWWLGRSGLMLAGMVAVAIVVIGSVWGFQTFKSSRTVSGSFGTISRTELANNKFATLETSMGNIKIQLNTDETPKTVANFVLLAKKNFFDGIAFHRVMKDFMIQTGDPNSKDDDPSNDGTGGPGYKFNNEKIVGEYTRGTVAMANSGPDTNGSQFFIMHKDNTSMPKDYVIFGKVVEGMDVVDKIANAPVVDNGQGEMSRPKEAVIINKVMLTAQ